MDRGSFVEHRVTVSFEGQARRHVFIFHRVDWVLHEQSALVLDMRASCLFDVASDERQNPPVFTPDELALLVVAILYHLLLIYDIKHVNQLL